MSVTIGYNDIMYMYVFLVNEIFTVWQMKDIQMHLGQMCLLCMKYLNHLLLALSGITFTACHT